MSDLDGEYNEWFDSNDFKLLMQETTANLKKLADMQLRMRFQFGDPAWYEEFAKAVQDAQEGWMSSWC